MARIISQIDPGTGRRVKTGEVRGNTIGDRMNNTAKITSGLNFDSTNTFNAFSPLGPINVSELNAPAKPMTTGQSATPTLASGLFASLEATPTTDVNTQAKNNTAGLVDIAGMDDRKKSISGVMAQYLRGLTAPGQDSLTSSAYETEGVNTAKKELNDINAKIESRRLDYRRQIERIQKNEGGLETSGVQGEIGRVEREAASELADLAIIQNAKNNSYDTAREIADRKVAAEMEIGSKKLDALKFLYEENRDQFNKDEDRQFNLMISERERLLTEQATEKKAVNDLALNALQNGAPASLVERALKSPTQQGAIGLIGGYVNSLDRAIKLEQLAKAKADRAKVELENKGNTPEQAERKVEVLTLANNLLKDTAVGKGSAVGASLAKLVPLGQTLGLQGNRTAFESQVNTLKSNLTLDNLKLLKGAMSDKDLLFLNSIGSSLDVNMSEDQFNKELGRIMTKLDPDGSITKSLNEGETSGNKELDALRNKYNY